ncbi:acetate/propionate family kinase [Helicobacter sp. MIT 14-3879]|uniref:acetate/propionate family kinase n=1 Tax=Helicobacter sp. MIT 14-3879 TaxID=2040649 RepID=UPI000E1E6A29|nr:acetate kinase [Helicobacter sp. MIT 14-3879]RDU62259.1 acetate kinase [Helicobacter sp. MIT 14-3879]
MNILVINCGSSSLKYQLININSEEVLAQGICDRIYLEGSILKHKAKDKKIEKQVPMPDHKSAIGYVFEILTDGEYGAIKSLDEIKAIGHRAVHGGEYFRSSVLADDNVIETMRECSDLAPLHNPANITGLIACKELMPDTPMVCVFDTAFHATIEPVAYLYATPYEWYEKYKVRKYGFHGTSHYYVSRKTAEFLGLDINNSKIITCHLGNGSSICAVKNGKSIDTSMGLSPLEGIAMGTRSGDLDPAVLQHIAKKENLNIDEVLNILNKKSGVLGISKLSSDFRDLLKAENEGNELAKIARRVFAYRVAKYIGSYVVAMNGVDAIAFCAGIGENAVYIRGMIVEHLEFLGVKLDKDININTIGKAAIISTQDSKVKICVMPTNEELVIAQDTFNIVSKL